MSKFHVHKTYAKAQETMYKECIANLRCCICYKTSEIVCNECLAVGELACFCDNHKERHKTERAHMALWGKLAE